MAQVATRHGGLTVCFLATCALGLGCKRDPGPELQIVGESYRIRIGDPAPETSPWFDGARVKLVAAQGETLGLQIMHRGGGPVTLTLTGARVAGFDVEPVRVTRPSTALYGGSHGAGSYPDGLVATAAPTSDPAYFEVNAHASGTGELAVAGRRIPVELTVLPVVVGLPTSVWAYYDPRELGGAVDAPNDAERACIAMFARYGVLLSPDLPASAWPARKDLVRTDVIPAVIPDDPATVGDAVRAWVDQTKGANRVAFAIPIDEPHTPEAWAKVHALATAVHAAANGRFLLAVTGDYAGPDVDLYITLHARRDDRFLRWTYNGAPPHAGSMVVDAESPGLRTWGWIAYRWGIPIWYVWDALYWHDRHDHRTTPPRPLDPAHDAVSFDDGDDHGNLDGVLALPGCQPTLRLAALRRGLEDRDLLYLAEACAPTATAKLAEQMVPRALGDAGPTPSWPSDEAAWETARRRLLELASPCAKR